MTRSDILFPAVALAFWTFAVLLLIPFQRFRAAFRGDVTPEDFELGESERVPASVSLPNRNYMNLLELPMLFYIASLAVYETKSVDATMLGLAWVYVALRIIHSLIHLTYNNVIHRLLAFASSNVALVTMWVFLFIKLRSA